MDEIIDIDVTQDCINKGHKRHEKFCPIGLAFRNAGIEADIYGARNIVIREDIGDYTIMDANPSIGKFITDFDYDYTVKPFSFKYYTKEHKIVCEASLSVYEQFPVRG